MDDKELLKQADEFLEITRPTSLARVSGVSLVYKMKARLEELTADKEPQSIVWEPKEGEEYYAVNAAGSAYQGIWNGSNHNQALLRYHNIYKTRELAQKAAQHQRRFNMVLQAVLNLEPNQVVDWSDKRQNKYAPYFNQAARYWQSGGCNFSSRTIEFGYPVLTDKKNVQPLLDYLNAKEKENG